jgi:DNA-binding MarR family transcriptional regulator
MPKAPSLSAETLADVASLRLAISRLERRLRRDVSSTLTPTQLSVFGSIQSLGELSLGELAAAERLSAPALSKLVTSLEEEGLVERVRDEQDRRVWRARVTEYGRKWAAKRTNDRNTWLVKRFERLEPEEQQALLAALPVLDRLVEMDD